MARVCSVFLIAVLFFILIGVAAVQVDLGEILENSGFEADFEHSRWTATVKGTGYRLDAPVVNPVIVPKNASARRWKPPPPAANTLSASRTLTERISKGAWFMTP